MSEAHREIAISSDRVFSGRAVAVDVDRVRLPDGKESVREVVRHPGAAVLLPRLDDGRLVFVRQYRYPVGEELLELPAGTLEPGEDLLTCAARELAEETGLRAASLDRLGSFFSTPGFTDEVLHGVMATGLSPAEGGNGTDPDEYIEVVVLSVDEAFELVRSGRVRDAKSLATLLLGRLQGWI